MSIFITGGTLGFSLGPLYAVSVVGTFGLERTWIAAIPGLVIAALMVACVRAGPRDRASRHRAILAVRAAADPPSAHAALLRGGVPLGRGLRIHLVPAARAPSPRLLDRKSAAPCSRPIWARARSAPSSADGSRTAGEVAASSWRRFLVAAPLFFGFLFLPGAIGLVCLALGGFALQGSLPVNVVMGQELSPRHTSTISSLLMGAAWGLGALLVGPTGALADARGLPTALTALACLLGVGPACAACAARTVRGRPPWSTSRNPASRWSARDARTGHRRRPHSRFDSPPSVPGTSTHAARHPGRRRRSIVTAHIEVVRPAAILAAARRAPPVAMVVFDASGDLTHRKLMPALFRLFETGALAENFAILRRLAPLDDAGAVSRRDARGGGEPAFWTPARRRRVADLRRVARLHSGRSSEPTPPYQRLASRLPELDRERGARATGSSISPRRRASSTTSSPTSRAQD